VELADIVESARGVKSNFPYNLSDIFATVCDSAGVYISRAISSGDSLNPEWVTRGVDVNNIPVTSNYRKSGVIRSVY
jgi:hypothetical protein